MPLNFGRWLQVFHLAANLEWAKFIVSAVALVANPQHANQACESYELSPQTKTRLKLWWKKKTSMLTFVTTSDSPSDKDQNTIFSQIF